MAVYFADCSASGDVQIDPSDDIYLAELLNSKYRQYAGLDLLLETNGGMTDATEKICSLLRQKCPDLRVIVPRRAKSNGTVIALCGQSIVMGLTSELGPIDPSVFGVPVEFILNQPASFNAIEVQAAHTARMQTTKLARELLSTGMMAGEDHSKIEEAVAKLASRDHYHSHGSVIDPREAISLGLKVEKLDDTDALWQRIWLLRTMYAYDCERNGYAKLFEGERVSTAVAMKPQAPTPGT